MVVLRRPAVSLSGWFSSHQMPGTEGGLDAIACLRQGSIGALGAIPGTMCAHPMDVLKIR